MSSSSNSSITALLPLAGLILFVGAVVCFVLAATASASSAAIVPGLSVVGAALLLAAAAFSGEAVRMTSADGLRQRAALARDAPRRHLRARAQARLVGMFLGRTDGAFFDGKTARWLPVLLPTLAAAIALWVVLDAWSSPGESAGSGNATAQALLGGILILASFPLVVLNRIHARRGSLGDLNAAHLELSLRVPLLALVAVGAAQLLASLGYAWPRWIERGVMLVVIAVALETVLLALVQLFIPAPAAGHRGPLVSRLARLIQPRWPRGEALIGGVQRQLGIDLSRSWAASFVRQALAPVALGLLVFGWLLTGLTTLGIDQRGIVERFGKPVSVDGPGLHVHLPWPFGRVRPVELGVVHEIPIVFASAADQPAVGQIAAPSVADAATVGAEAMPPASVDRLWDKHHPSEASYLIASDANGQQGFEIVNIDLRVVYRIGPSNADAMAATYHVDDIQALIRASAGRLLVQHFSQYTLSDVLGENRAAFIHAFRSGLQQRLDRLHTGTEIAAVVVEAIHPPPAAAQAYHNVQAAQIRALTQISNSRAKAYTERGQAQQQAVIRRDAAMGQAAENLGAARAASTLFTGDEAAYRVAGQTFLRERWFSHLQQNLSQAPLLIVDDRLRDGRAPTIDMRRFVPPYATTPAPPASK